MDYIVYNICALINNALYVNQRDYILYNPLVSRATPPIARGKGVPATDNTINNLATYTYGVSLQVK